MTRSALIVALLSWPALSQVSKANQSWDSFFQDSWTAQTHGEFAKARDLAEKAWTMVKLAGPATTRYSDGVEQAYATLINISGTLRAENIYGEALKATEPTPLQAVRLQILLRMAFRLVGLQQ